MKTFPIILALVALVFSRATAQVTLDLTLNQEEFLAGEALPVTVKITNQSGQRLHLGAEANWLTFSVESAEGRVVSKNFEVPVAGEFDLESSQMGTLHFDIAPSFAIAQPGRYTVTATLRIKPWGLELNSAVKSFDVISGAKLWSQDFGVPKADGMPEMRQFSLEQASYLHSQMRLYMQLSDAQDGRIYKTTALGQTVSFSRPAAQVDRTSRLHVLWQSGSQSFDYRIISPDGVELNRDIYDDVNTRPKLVVNDSGEVIVLGGVRRPKPGEAPPVIVPLPGPAATSAPATNWTPGK